MQCSELVPRRPLLLGAFLLLTSAGVAQQGPRVHFRSWPIPTPDSEPIEITAGPDGNLWFTQQDASQVTRVTPQGVITEFPLPTLGFPSDITAGPDGNVWFSEGANGNIGFITPAGAITEIPFSSNGSAGGICTGPDGNIWFTDSSGNAVWRFELASATLTSFPLPTPSSLPTRIIAGPDSNLWFIAGGLGRLARMTLTGQVTELPEQLSLPFALCAGPDGSIWLVERFNQRIARVAPAGQFTFFATSLHTLESIVSAPDGNLWFTSFGDHRLGRITPGGALSEVIRIPGSPSPTGLCVGPAGVIPSLWILGYGNGRVYAMTLP
jgi:streptogramin lyase